MRLSPAWLIALLAASVLGCGSSPPPKPVGDVTLVEETSAAREAYNRGLIDNAAKLYQQSLDRARAMDDAVGIGNASYNLAACEIDLQQYARASDLLAEAAAETRRAGRDASDIDLVMAKVKRLQNDLPAAESSVAGVLNNPKAADALKIQANVIRGEIAIEQHDISKAESSLAAARAIKTDDLALRAAIAGLNGMVAEANRNSSGAAGAFDEEAALLQQAHLYPDMAAALSRAADAYRLENDFKDAGDRAFRSARSMAGQGDIAGATPLIARALQDAKAANDAELAARIERLASEVVAATTNPATANPATINPATMNSATANPSDPNPTGTTLP